MAIAEPECPSRISPTSREGERLERAFEAHHSEILAFARRRTADRSAADDVASEVFAVATRRASELPRRPRGWLIGIARKVLANHYRTEERRAALIERLQEQPSAEADSIAPAGQLGPALAELDEDDRELLLLRYWEGLSGRELAAACDCSLPAVYVRLHRARARLAERLDRYSEQSW